MTNTSTPAFLPASTMERRMNEELIAADLVPTISNPVVNIENLLEAHLKVKMNQHADLPLDVLGVTTFEQGKAPFVEINRDLSGAADDGGTVSQIGRWRITLAHEACHVILHRQEMERIFTQPTLFEDANISAAPQQRCLKRDLAALRVNPWEYQANYCMAALLMPRQVFASITAPMFAASKVAACHINDPQLSLIIDEIAEIFQVSRTAARIRIQTLGIQGLAQQARLEL